MRILICDDAALMVGQLQQYIKTFFEKIVVKCPELVCFSDGESLLADKGEKDILFLDVEMCFHVFRYLSKPLDKQRFFRNMKDAVDLYHTMTVRLPIETKQGGTYPCCILCHSSGSTGAKSNRTYDSA